jgi:hypothetical protein
MFTFHPIDYNPSTSSGISKTNCPLREMATVRANYSIVALGLDDPVAGNIRRRAVLR